MKSKEEIILEAFGVSKKYELMTEHFIGLSIIPMIEKAMQAYARQALDAAAEDIGEEFEKEFGTRSDYFNHRLGLFMDMKAWIVESHSRTKKAF